MLLYVEPLPEHGYLSLKTGAKPHLHIPASVALWMYTYAISFTSFGQFQRLRYIVPSNFFALAAVMETWADHLYELNTLTGENVIEKSRSVCSIPIFIKNWRKIAVSMQTLYLLITVEKLYFEAGNLKSAIIVSVPTVRQNYFPYFHLSTYSNHPCTVSTFRGFLRKLVIYLQWSV